ncbi:MAG: hypothetical protein ACRECY_14145, partial [Phyllobacterium sp.]
FTLALVRQTCLFNHTGHPVLAMPMHAPQGAPPPSLQIVGRHSEEGRLLNFAAKLERDLIAKA